MERDFTKDFAVMLIATKDNRRLRVSITRQVNLEVNIYFLMFDLVNAKAVEEVLAFYHTYSDFDELGWDLYNCTEDLSRDGRSLSVTPR
jgi:hypothetical protein